MSNCGGSVPGQQQPAGPGGGGTNRSPDIPHGLSSSSTLSEEVKMSIRSISSEITIFEIKTPLPDRTVPPCTAGSTTITTIGSVVSTASSASSTHTLSHRQHGSQGGGSLLSLNNKQIQLQPISSSPLSRSQQMAAQSRGLSITASTAPPPQNPSSSSSGINHGLNVIRRAQQSILSPNILLNQHHKVTLAPVRNNTNTLNKLPIRHLAKAPSPFINLKPKTMTESSVGLGRFDPLMMLETQMVEEEREINPVIENMVNKSIVQVQQTTIKRPPNRFTSMMQPLHQTPSLSVPMMKPLIQPQQQQSRRKSVLVQLVELPDEDSVSSNILSFVDSNVISKPLSTLAPLPVSLSPVVTTGISSSPMKLSYSNRPLIKAAVVGSFDSLKKTVKISPRTAQTPGRSRTSKRKKKRKLLFPTNRLSMSPKSSLVKPPKTAPYKPPMMKPLSSNNSSAAVPPPVAVSAPPITSMYRTRTMVKASLAAETRKLRHARLAALLLFSNK
jgi:hypothetical protein